MPAPIAPISTPALAEPLTKAVQSASGASFQDAFAEAVQTVQSFGQNAHASVERLLSGEGEELHTTILATQQAELSFDLFMQMRNKVVSAYQEIMRMQM
jgi:flagellar hook-basal body complex protein FliE